MSTIETVSAALADSSSGAAPRPAQRRNSARDNLFAATMLVPVAAIAVLAVGKITLRRVDSIGFVQAAQAQQNIAPPPPSSSTPRAAPPRVGTGTGTAGAATGASTDQPVPPTSRAPTTAAAAGASSAAVAVLLEQANYWRNQPQYDQALESLNRALALDPRNPDALALIGQIQADRGNRPAAENALGRLRAVAPGDPRIEKIDQALRVGPIPQEALADARRLARDGRQAEAIDRYNRVFRGNPPPDSLAVEYYQTLAGTEGGWEQARDGLARTVRQNPQDLRAQLAYAQILTYREGARARASAGSPRWRATRRWPSRRRRPGGRRWLAAREQDPRSIRCNVYLQSHPDDTDIASKLEAARNPPVTGPIRPPRDRIAGIRGAEQEQAVATRQRCFRRRSTANPNDADATGGLGHRAAAPAQLRRSQDAARPRHRARPRAQGRWQQALNGANQGAAGGAAGGGGGGGKHRTCTGDDQPRRLCRPPSDELQAADRASGSDKSGGLQSMLADAQAQQGRLGEAEASYRESLALNPRKPRRAGRAGRRAVARRAQRGGVGPARAGGGDRGRAAGGPGTGAAAARAGAGDQRPGDASRAVPRGGRVGPANPWLRLDFARSLVKQGQLPRRARSWARRSRDVRAPTRSAAAIIFANETQRPGCRRGADRGACRRTRGRRTCGCCRPRRCCSARSARRSLLSPQAARQRLLAMAASPDPDGVRGAAIARALYKIGDKAGARDAIIVAQSSTRNANPGAKLNYAAA